MRSGDAIDYENRPDHKRSWLLVSLVVAAVRGVITDNLITHPRGFRAINDEEFGDWVIRHGGHPDVLESAFVRGLYDLVFGYEQADPERPAVGAGVMIFLIGSRPVRVQGCDLLEDDGRNGRRRDRAALSGTSKARREVRVLPSR